jgi:signal transduction histidine kinase
MGIFNRKIKTTEVAAPVATSNSKNLSEIVLQSIREGVMIVSANGNITLANPMACTMIGRNANELVGISLISAVNLVDKSGNAIAENANPIIVSIRTGEVTEHRDLSLLNIATNKVTPISLIATPTSGAGSGVVVTMRDIAQELKEESERMDFISTASQEMRTPVASIEGYLGLAMNPATATIDERAKEYLSKAHESSQHLGRLFQDLLDTTKLDDGLMKVHMEPVELSSLVKQYAEAQAPNVQAKGLNFQFGSGFENEQSNGLKMSPLYYASVDKDFLQEVVNNLIENAIKYTPSGRVSVFVTGDDHSNRIIIEDTGIGIPRDEIEHIFQKFYRVDNSDTREIGGTGLGLALVKQRVEAMGGQVWAESEQGKGSRFIVMLPRLSDEAYGQQKFLHDNQQAQAANSAATAQQ